ncbi:hypothetical protein [Ectothiorhodospira variabilis]|uniref:hypothetical protein n=1 Tax=Ectothiorhodospira variabilis TaxID=505694 RepID=UPI001EFBB6DE|nr:hypothetical protein [Ectothiorhodospira variabilis]MCG5496034.1 hypothetical protein [Ectothiorhodospira variabilis]MCG5505402.1 hypothetical protein [Ectothiorhodospira variabilis]MCG5508588.1 hypothetical protein [Ectothiorhodospira variabilis]
MNVKVQKTAPSDRLIEVNGAKMMQYVNQNDLSFRAAQTVIDAYHQDWFYSSNGKDTYFIPPAGYLKDGEIYFINGRHRFILLHRHLARFPFLIGNIDGDNIAGIPSKRSLSVLRVIKERSINEHIQVAIPTLRYGNFPKA